MATRDVLNNTLSGQTGTGNYVGANTPTLITPVIGAATGTSLNLGSSTTMTGMINDSTMATASTSTAASSSSIKTYVDGKAGCVRISRQNVTSVAAVDFTGLDFATYSSYFLTVSYMHPATDGVSLNLRTSTNNGVSFDAGASDYRYCESRMSTSITGSVSTGASAILLVNDSIGFTSLTEAADGIIEIYYNTGTIYQTITSTMYYQDSSGVQKNSIASGQRLSTTTVNAVRVLFSSGNISNAIVTLYGLLF